MDTSFLTQQVTSIIGQLHNVFDEIGVPHHERDSRESELFTSLSETLHSHLRLVTSEKNELVEQAQRIITTIKQMEASLDDSKQNSAYSPSSEELKITFPLLECLQGLKEKHKVVNKLHQERFEQVKKLVQALESYSSHLEPSFLQIKLPTVAADGTVAPTFDLSPSYITSVDSEFTRVYEEYTKRVGVVQQLGEEIVKLWAELGTPQAQTDTSIVKHYKDNPEQLGLHKDDLSGLRSRREKLLDEKKARERRLKELRAVVEGLWDRLGIEEPERRAFIAGNRGCGLRAINDLEDELARLNELKRQNLGIFVEDARSRLQNLWDDLFFSEEEAVEFTPMFCDVISDALLSAHEAEIERLESLKEQRAPTLQLVAKHKSLIKDREDLAASSQDASRLMMKGNKGEKRDPTRLLREEKMRKRIAKELPKVEQDLRKELEKWEDDYGRPFLVFGEHYLETLAVSNSKALPPRSKTPNGLPPRSKTPNCQQSVKLAKQQQSTAQKITQGTLRAKTPVGAAGRHPLVTSAQPSGHHTIQQKSPSRIPARVPLSSMPHGNNSPERQYHTMHAQHSPSRKMGPPMAPPPKMRDLFVPPKTSTPSTIAEDNICRSGSVVRQMPPEDPYGGHSLSNSRSFMQPSTTQIPETYRYSQTSSSQQSSYRGDASSVADTASSRQISVTSDSSSNYTSNTAVSGSENWESYEEGSDLGTDAYCTVPRNGRLGYVGKRGPPEGGFAETYGVIGKKLRPDAGWADEDPY